MAESSPPTTPADSLSRRMAASLAHHVNNALTGVVGCFELALRDARPGSAQEGHLRAGLACAHQAAASVRQVVAYTAASTRPETLEPVSLREIAEGTARRLSGQAGPVSLAVEGGPPGWVLASPTLLRTVLEQLVRNALEAMPTGGTLRLRVAEVDDHCALAVEDTGCGMTPEVRLRLFEPFVTTKPSGHLGLGLVLAREMTLAQGGTLDVASAVGRGTAVTIGFPSWVARPVAAAEPAYPAAQQASSVAESAAAWPPASGWAAPRQTA